MRIAFTGASSTGKTTVAERLMDMPEFNRQVPIFLPSGGREILDGLGFRGIDSMSRSETAFYELSYFVRKLAREREIPAFLADRSYLDVAAYWLERDALHQSAYLQDLLLEPCRRLSHDYDLHFYFPADTIPFVPDGRRSLRMDLQKRVSNRIRQLANDWEIPLVVVKDPDLDRRIDFILETLSSPTASESWPGSNGSDQYI